jgi:hypothetical protein
MSAGEVVKEIVYWLPVAGFVAGAIVAIIPQGKPGSALDKFRTVLNYLALNVGNARNYYKYYEEAKAAQAAGATEPPPLPPLGGSH